MISPCFASMFGLGVPELMIICTLLVVLLVFAAIPAILAYTVLQRIPPQFRKQQPGLAFLVSIPLFSVVWNFFVHPKVAESLQACFDAHGPHPHGDCGGSLALWLCICGVCAFVPIVGLFAAIAGLVLLIMFYTKAFALSASLPTRAAPPLPAQTHTLR